MSEGSRHARVFSVAPGAPFLDTVARALLAGEIIPGFPQAPQDCARATIFTPTHRAARALTAALVRVAKAPVAILPNVVPLGRIEGVDDGGALDLDDADAADDLAPRAVDEFERRLVLAAMIRRWARSIRNAILHVEDDGRFVTHDRDPLLVGTSLASAWALAGDLGFLIDEFTIEGLDWSRLDDASPAEYDRYWGIAHAFLRIAAQQWPAYLEDNGLVDRAALQTLQIDRAIERLQGDGPAAPLLVVGSTGANAATARLLAAVARAPQGAVVLPGLDTTLDDRAWSLLDDAESEPLSTHPQAILARLLKTMGLRRGDVAPLGDIGEAAAARNRLVSEALRPAETTDAWMAMLQAPDAGAWMRSLSGVALAETADEREEALAIAIKLREAVESGARAALVTPDRGIARRVRAQMRRWSIECEDSAGDPLARAPRGTYARLVLEAAAESGPVALLALLKHPLARFDRRAADVERLARLVDLGYARSSASGRPFDAAALEQARQESRRRDAHRNARAIGDADWAAIGAVLQRCDAALQPLRRPGFEASVAAWAAAHRDAIAATRPTASRFDGDGGDELDDALARLIEYGRLGDAVDLAGYRRVFDQIVADVAVRGVAAATNAPQILGLLEARLLPFDTIVLAGLDEGLWPPRAGVDPFLNRAMRAHVGLSSPDRRIGQTAHDFTQALGARDALIVRARKRDGAPTIASRFLQRLSALVGPEAWRACLARGESYVAWARAIDDAPPVRIPPPMPRPPLGLRPSALSLTRVETLRRDPYSVYAEFVLKLTPLPGFDAGLGPRDYGVLMHALVAAFSALRIDDPSPAAILAAAREAFGGFFEIPGFGEFTWPRLARALAAYLDWHRARAPTLRAVDVEQAATLDVKLADGSTFALRARADRIERDERGGVSLFDFKSGRIPTAREIKAGFAPQLVLEAKMLAMGAFEGGAATPAAAWYVKLGGANDLDAKNVGADTPLDQLMAEQYEGLLVLLNQLRDPSEAFPSRPFPQFVSRFGEYDHLARVKEWSAVAGEETG